MCNAKIRSSKLGTHCTNNKEYKFWFCPHDIKGCVSGTKKKYVLDWPIVFNTWPMKMGTNLSREEVLALDEAGFQLQQREALSPGYRLSTIPTIPIPCFYFCMLLNPNAHPPFKFGKTMRRIPTTPTADHKNKWESTGLIDC